GKLVNPLAADRVVPFVIIGLFHQEDRNRGIGQGGPPEAAGHAAIADGDGKAVFGRGERYLARTDAVIQGEDDGALVAGLGQGAGERAGDVRQAAGFGKADHLGGGQQQLLRNAWRHDGSRHSEPGLAPRRAPRAQRRTATRKTVTLTIPESLGNPSSPVGQARELSPIFNFSPGKESWKGFRLRFAARLGRAAKRKPETYYPLNRSDHTTKSRFRTGPFQSGGIMADTLTIRCRENGPLVIQGPVRVLDHLGNEFLIPAGKDTIALCRCGQSKNKPFCDGSHRQCGFRAAETAKPPEGHRVDLP